MSLLPILLERIRAGGPMTVAAYMDLALYHEPFGYYARAAKRSGREGDFYTSVDVGPLFGEMLAVQFGEMRELLGRGERFDLVEAGAGSGTLARDVLDAAAADPELLNAIDLHLVERSPEARAAQHATLGPFAQISRSLGVELPPAVRGVIYANELLDALPAHQVVMRPEGLREVFVDANEGRLVEREGAVSDPAIAAYLDRAGANLHAGWRAEVNLAAISWMRRAARSLERGFIVLVDYGHEAAELFSASHAAGTLRSFHRHQVDPDAGPGWLQDPGGRDITLHVDFTSIRQAAEDEGLETLGLLDQTYFLMGLGIAERLAASASGTIEDLRRRMAVKTLMLPGGLGSTHKVLILGKGVGRPALRGLSARNRVT